MTTAACGVTIPTLKQSDPKWVLRCVPIGCSLSLHLCYVEDSESLSIINTLCDLSSSQALSIVWNFRSGVEPDRWGFPSVGRGVWKVSTSCLSHNFHSNLCRLYYKNNPTRLSTCPLTIHALLHIAWGIKVARPCWTYWDYPIKHHCNILLQEIKSRCHPFVSINSFVTAIVQIDHIQLSYDLYEALCLDHDKKENNGFTHDSCKFSTMISAIDAHLPLILFSIDPLFLLATPSTMRNLTSANTKQSLGLFSNSIQCPEEGC